MPDILCPERVICDCSEDPFANLSAEAVDVDRFFSVLVFHGDPPLGGSWTRSGCKSVAYSTVSQAEADLAALRQAQECTWDGPTGGWRTPPTILHPNGQQRQIFSNEPQVCMERCPDGTPFYVAIPFGRILAFTQEEANFLAFNYACKMAMQERLCLGTIDSTACQGTFFQTNVIATGGSLSDPPATNEWSIVAGALPPGLTFHGSNIQGGQATINGTPTATGIYHFSIQVTTQTGVSVVKAYTIAVAAITTASALPDGTLGAAYSQVLAQTGLSEPVLWDVVVGTLPAGLTLDPETGEIAGVPTEAGIFAFTIGATGL